MNCPLARSFLGGGAVEFEQWGGNGRVFHDLILKICIKNSSRD